MVRPTIEDVAAEAKVSIGTVSNVLNRPGLVREDKRLRVERAIERSLSARSDRAAKRNLFGWQLVAWRDWAHAPAATELHHV